MPDHRDYMVALALEYGWKRGVELGLGRAMLFRRLLGIPDIYMIGVDIGARADRIAAQDAVTLDYPGRCKVLRTSTANAASQVPDGWADFVFVDAGHGYEAVKDDIARWRCKVRPGGWFGGHDFHKAHPGVIRAVAESFGRRFEVLDHWIWKAT